MLKNKYFIAILPDAAISGQITLFRKTFLAGLNAKDEHKKFPHITLQHTFSRAEEIEKEIDPYLSQLRKKIKPFSIVLSGTGHFDNRIIYIKVMDQPLLIDLYIEVKKILTEKLNFASNEVASSFTPHVTLEKKITRQDFQKYWDQIKNIPFEGTFVADSFSLMRHTGIKWEEIRRYDLG